MIREQDSLSKGSKAKFRQDLISKHQLNFDTAYKMQLLITIASCLLLVHSVLGSPYQNVRPCKSNTEPCVSLGCPATTQSFGKFPQSTTYSCCLGKIYDKRNHVCVGRGGVTRMEACNPCTEFQCGSGECILHKWKCNGIKNCVDGSDQMGCGSCGKDYFRCKNNRCVYKQHVCDKVNNCGDGTDETDCLKPDGTKCGMNRYRCDNNKCISKSYVCDGDNDCGDSSDEHGCPWSGAGKKRSIRYLNKHNVKEDNNKTEEANNEPKDAGTPAILMKN